MQSAAYVNDWFKDYNDFCKAETRNENDMQVEQTFAVGSLATKLRKLTSKRANEQTSSMKTPMERMQDCRDGLAILDKKGWNRSFHQRLFHEDFLVRPCR